MLPPGHGMPIASPTHSTMLTYTRPSQLPSGHGMPIALPAHSTMLICTRPSQPKSGIDGGGALQAPPPTEELLAVDRCWGGGGSFLFEGVTNGRFLWMALHPHTYGQH